MSKQELLRPGALYIRVSTHGRQEELSPAAQKRMLLNYAKDHGKKAFRFWVGPGPEPTKRN